MRRTAEQTDARQDASSDNCGDDDPWTTGSHFLLLPKSIRKAGGAFAGSGLLFRAREGQARECRDVTKMLTARIEVFLL